MDAEYQSGELLAWLEVRFYEDEADAVAEIHTDDRNSALKICAALNIDSTRIGNSCAVSAKRNFCSPR